MEQVDVKTIAKKDIDTVIKGIKNLFDTYRKEAGFIDTVVMVPYKPTSDFGITISDGPVITYRLVRRRPGAVSGKPFSGTSWKVPRTIEIEPDVLGIEGEQTDLMFYDNELEFRVFSTDASIRDATTMTFEDFMQLVRGAFRRLGVCEIYMSERLSDDAENIDDTQAFYSVLKYYVRTNKTFASNVGLIKEILTNAKII